MFSFFLKRKKLIVLTGGPCAGKTTVLNLLQEQGYSVISETAREIIEKQIAKGGDIVPWIKLKEFQRAVAWNQFFKELFSEKNSTAFLDRSLIDGVGYSRLGNILPYWIIQYLGRNRYDMIFFLERLPLYLRDETRIEKEEFANNVSEEIRNAYKEYGYKTESVPILTPEERVRYILERIK